MAVVKIESGEVVQVWQDVVNVAAAVAKYGLDPATLVEGDHPPGTLYDGAVFTAPERTPTPEEESQVIQALRDLADAIDDTNPGARAGDDIIARFGPRPSQGQN